MSGISVIIPMYNKRYTIERSIQSVLNQTGVDWELIVVDDGSTDGSAKLVRAFGDGIKYIYQNNAGPSSARNHGAKIAKYSALVFLDADDELEPHCLAKHYECRLQNSATQISLASFIVKNRDGVVRSERLVERVSDFAKDCEIIYVKGFRASLIQIASGAICINKVLFEIVGGFDEELKCWEITELLYRVMLTEPLTAILNNYYVIINECADNSQYLSTKKNVKYIYNFGIRLLSRIEDVPVSEQESIFVNIKKLLYELARPESYYLFKRMAKQACGHTVVRENAPKLCYINRMPFFLLRGFGFLLIRKYLT